MTHQSSLVTRVSSQSITVILDGKIRTVNAQASNFHKLQEALKEGAENQRKQISPAYDLDLIRDLVDISTFIARETHGLVTISDNQVRYRGEKQTGMLVDRILQHLENGYSVAPLANFMDKLMSNPSTEVREDLFAWLESGDMPIADDGDIIAFKKVQSDYYSFYSGKRGKVLHQMGTVVEIPREEVDPNRRNECSNGLHFCSYGYLSNYHGNSGRVLMVKINPADVVAIPTDYGRQKGRTFRMFVYDEVAETEAKAALSGKLVAPKTGLIAQEKTARISTTEDNNLGTDIEGGIISIGRLRGLLAHGGVAYTAEQLGIDISRVDALAEQIDFKRENLGVLQVPKTAEELAAEEAVRIANEAAVARQKTFIEIFGGDLEVARSAIDIIDDEIVKNGGDTHAIYRRLNGTTPAFRAVGRYTVDGKTDYASFTRDYHKFRGLPVIDGPNDDVVDEPKSNVASTVKVQTVKKASPKGLSFTHGDTTYTAKKILDGVAKDGQRGFSAKTGIPRTTLQTWIARIKQS